MGMGFYLIREIRKSFPKEATTELRSQGSVGSKQAKREGESSQ